jgi:hypothetical protein
VTADFGLWAGRIGIIKAEYYLVQYSIGREVVGKIVLSREGMPREWMR